MNLSRWLVHTITVQEPTTRAGSAYGDIAWKNPCRVKARVERTTTRVKNGDGDEVISTHRVIVSSFIDERARFWLPSINGEPADDVDEIEASRTPLTVQGATTRAGTRGHWEFFF
jgi:hypothetical protein